MTLVKKVLEEIYNRSHGWNHLRRIGVGWFLNWRCKPRAGFGRFRWSFDVLSMLALVLCKTCCDVRSSAPGVAWSCFYFSVNFSQIDEEARCFEKITKEWPIPMNIVLFSQFRSVFRVHDTIKLDNHRSPSSVPPRLHSWIPAACHKRKRSSIPLLHLPYAPVTYP